MVARDENGRRAGTTLGKKHAKTENGMVTITPDRGCTDLFFLLLFILFWAGMVAVGIAGFVLGNPRRLTYGTDSWGNSCGAKNGGISGVEGLNGVDLRGKEYLFFGNPFNPDEIQICVEECPLETPSLYEILNATSLNLEFSSLIQYMYASESVEANASTVLGLISVDPSIVFCPPNFGNDITLADISLPSPLATRGSFYDPSKPCYFRYSTTGLLRRCAPSPTEAFLNSTFTAASTVSAIDAADVAGDLLADVNEAKYAILGCCFIALGLAFLWLVFLRFFATIMVWVTIFVFLAVCAGITAFFFVQASTARDIYNKNVADGTATDRMKYNYVTLTVLAIVCAVVVAVILFLLLWNARNISLAAKIIEEAADAMKSMPSLLLFPLIMFVVMGAFIAYWISEWLFLATAGEATYDSEGRLLEFVANRQVRGLQVYHVFGLLWTSQFLLGVGECVLAGAVATWYFTADKRKVEGWPLKDAVLRVLRYHLGSIAFGSLLIAIVQFIRLVIKYFERQLESMFGKSGWVKSLATFLLRCLDCCFWCLEKFLKFISRNAYIMVSIYGHSFCEAARDSFNLLMRNAMTLMIINIIGDFMLFLGKLIIALLTGIIAIAWLKDDPNLNYYAFPVMIIILLAYLIAAVFMSVFEMTIDTIFICVCEDLERNAPEPVWVSPRLKGYLRSQEAKITPADAPAPISPITVPS